MLLDLLRFTSFISGPRVDKDGTRFSLFGNQYTAAVIRLGLSAQSQWFYSQRSSYRLGI